MKIFLFNSPGQSAPFYCSKIPAGFPSPAEGYLENRLSLDDFITHPNSSFFAQVESDSMHPLLQAGDFLLVDKSLDFIHNDLVLAYYDGGFTVKRYMEHKGKRYLVPDNPKYQKILLTEEMQVQLWGVISSIHRRFRNVSPS